MIRTTLHEYILANVKESEKRQRIKQAARIYHKFTERYRVSKNHIVYCHIENNYRYRNDNNVETCFEPQRFNENDNTEQEGMSKRQLIRKTTINFKR